MTSMLRHLALFAALALVVSACTPADLQELLGLDEESEEQGQEAPETSEAADDGGNGMAGEAATEETAPDTGSEGATATLPRDLAELSTTTLTPGRYSLQTEGAFVTLPDTFEVGTASQDGVHRDDPSQVIGVLQRPPLLASEPAQFDALLDQVRHLGPGVEIVLDAPVDVAGAHQAHLIVAADGAEAVAYLMARAPLGAALIGYSAPVATFDHDVPAYLLQQLELGWEWLPPAPSGPLSFDYPADEGRVVEVVFEIPAGDWRVQDTYEQSLARFVTEDLQEIEYRLVSDVEADLDALVDDFEAWFPDADIQRHDVEVAGATRAMVAETDASGTDAAFSQSALMVTSDAGYTFQFSYLSGAGSYDPGTADEVLATFGLSVGG